MTVAERIDFLLEIGKELNSTLDLHTLLRHIILRTTQLLQVERGAVVLYDEDSERLDFFVALGDESQLQRIHLKKGEGFAGMVAETGQHVVVYDAHDNPRHCKKADDATGFQTRSLMAWPLVSREHLIGVLEVVNKLPSGSRFSEEDLRLCRGLSDFVAVAIQNAQNWHRAITDPLTELYNFGYFRQHLNSELKQARHGQRQLSLAMFDVDHFKHYNDTNGHQAGNDALQQVATILRETAGSTHFAARYGGEEFVALVDHATGCDGQEFAEAVRRRVYETDFTGGQKQPLGRVSISAGVATFPRHGELPDPLIVAADRNLYRAKESGRNRVICGERV
ncbi:MAG: GGDEF domain-containing protein [Candidatus Xenobia bacterium]